ncbi:hypothetical protein LIER_05410 [Lithospermum erythrorhizon]|uniref:Uncharacterized protein n=1 Tax=Lithospermum erythrorhizon TaxID=34254 RepID=A0AAV3P0R3_LITER
MSLASPSLEQSRVVLLMDVQRRQWDADLIKYLFLPVGRCGRNQRMVCLMLRVHMILSTELEGKEVLDPPIASRSRGYGRSSENGNYHLRYDTSYGDFI